MVAEEYIYYKLYQFVIYYDLSLTIIIICNDYIRQTNRNRIILTQYCLHL